MQRCSWKFQRNEFRKIAGFSWEKSSLRRSILLQKNSTIPAIQNMKVLDGENSKDEERDEQKDEEKDEERDEEKKKSKKKKI